MLRPRPIDFWERYVELGKPGCEAHYRAHWKTIDRWVEEVGKSEVRAERAKHVAERRKSNTPLVDRRESRVDLGQVDPNDLHAACQYLRENRNGGWRVGLRDDGSYFVGARHLAGSEVIAMALAKGMDEWYIERDMFKRFDLESVDEFVLDREIEL